MTDNVNHPQHYKGKGLECIDVIEAFDLGFCLGNAVKYILRAGRKDDRVVDIRKAIWYLQREIEKQHELISVLHAIDCECEDCSKKWNRYLQ
jgi:hypothetical protein